jgi:hypothetical protein
MKKMFSLLIAGSLLFNYSFAQETLQSVTNGGNNTTTNSIIVNKASGNWIAGNFGDNSGNNRVVMGYLSGAATIGAHNAALNAWANLAINSEGGNVGIGTTSPAYKLDVNGDVFMHNLRLGNIASIAPDGLTNNLSIIKDGNLLIPKGNVGIGTTSPTAHSGGRALVISGAEDGTRGLIEVWGENGGKSIFQSVVGDTYIGNLRRGTGNGDVYFAYGEGNTAAFIKGSDGNVGIGTTSPTQKLSVAGTVLAQKVKVSQPPSLDWPDYVFDSSYQLAPLHQVEKYIQQNKHLPEVPSAAEVKKDGIDLGDNQAVLLKKIEELTLYIIEQDKRIKKLEEERK